MKKMRGDEPIGVLIHTYVEISQGNSLHKYLYLKQAKMSCFSFYLFSFFFYKIRKQKGRIGTSGRGEVLEKGGRRMNMVQKMCTHVSKCKKDTY
jgi:hypothetical protein